MRKKYVWLKVFWFIALVFAAGFSPARPVSAAEPTASAALDGLIFFGQMGEPGQQAYADTLSFADGKFWSDICTRCGFRPGKYWTRNEADGIHFRGELAGNFGIFVYEGRITDGQATVKVIWKKQRWYWTSRRTLEFSGRTRAGEIPGASSQAEQIALDALKAKLPDFCW